MTDPPANDPNDPASPPRPVAMGCERLVHLLGEYVDNTLAQGDRVAFEGHMTVCGPCVAFVRQYAFAPVAARAALLLQAPPELEARLLSFLKKRVVRPK